jgi:hypothetical protein
MRAWKLIMKTETTSRDRDLCELLLLIADLVRATAERMQRAETPEPFYYQQEEGEQSAACDL